ncbi:MAG: hypothetical protein PHP07_03825 [Eubacteriales bacterium]|jgi:hypothetical protein|nr:hypothetical protein [Eubacteriales bacterium]MDD3572065.1 hypothetical protein [Eubacteriales bacterium]MDD4135193.1 hypothetical protein [Eubacteriales bacterium]NLO12892.1 hypothetical protein [Clostridiales bacterium]
MKRKRLALLPILFLCIACAFPSALAVESLGQDVTEEELEVGFEYFGRFIPAYAHLYGGALDSFADIKLANPGSENLSVLVQSWIEGVSEPAGEIVIIWPGASLVVKQSPIPSPGAFDEADTMRPGVFYVRVTGVGQDNSTVLYEDSAKAIVYGRRDFVWRMS